MAEPILAIFLVTSSASGPHVVFRWPPDPKSKARLTRARPAEQDIELDNPGKAIHFDDLAWSLRASDDVIADEGYEWIANEPKAQHESSRNDEHHHTELDSPIQQPARKDKDEYDDVRVFGYSSKVLASMLCPNTNLCHRRFELLVDDLVFIGHPVCADEDGIWRLKPEKYKSGSRGRGPPPIILGKLDEHGNPIEADESQGSWLESFHLCVVMDMPDPSSAASSNVSKYLDIVYDQVAFAVTAVLYQEQILTKLVAMESEHLSGIREEFFKRGKLKSAFFICHPH